MEGYAPDPEALDSLQGFLEQRMDKTTVTIQEPSQIPSANQDSYSANILLTYAYLLPLINS